MINPVFVSTNKGPGKYVDQRELLFVNIVTWYIRTQSKHNNSTVSSLHLFKLIKKQNQL